MFCQEELSCYQTHVSIIHHLCFMEVSVHARMLHKMRSVTLTTYVWCGVGVVMPVGTAV